MSNTKAWPAVGIRLEAVIWVICPIARYGPDAVFQVVAESFRFAAGTDIQPCYLDYRIGPEADVGE